MNKRSRLAAAACGALLSTAALSNDDPVLEWNSIMASTAKDELSAGRIQLGGDSASCRAFPQWLLLSVFARIASRR